jgi:hypothetical protein
MPRENLASRARSPGPGAALSKTAFKTKNPTRVAGRKTPAVFGERDVLWRLRAAEHKSTISSTGGSRPMAAVVSRCQLYSVRRSYRIGVHDQTVRFGIVSGLHSRQTAVPGWATKRLPHRNKAASYSISSSARARSESGTVMPSVFAVVRLMISLNRVGCSTGRSPGFSPLRMRPI